MSEQRCPACAQLTNGPYCSHCGAHVAGKVNCASCGNELPPGGRFCNQCGTPTAAVQASRQPAAVSVPAAPSSTLPWVVAGMAILALVIVLVFPRPQGDEAAADLASTSAAAPGDGSAFGDASSVDLSTMSPREQADALFNRVMQNVSAGDSTQARFFLPMAISAYGAVPELDADGHYHVAVLHLAGGDPAAARASADSILAIAPNHLFGLFTAAQAEQGLGNTAAARELYSRFSDSFDAEVALGRTEYSEHEAVMPMMREEARQALDEP